MPNMWKNKKCSKPPTRFSFGNLFHLFAVHPFYLPKTHQNSPVLTPFLISSWHHFFHISTSLLHVIYATYIKSYPQVLFFATENPFLFCHFSHVFSLKKKGQKPHLAAAGTLPAKETWVPFQTSENSDSLRRLVKIKKPGEEKWGFNML